MNVLFITNWFPTEDKPGSGPFVKEHAVAVHKQKVNVKIIQVRAVYSKKILHKRVEHRWEDGIEVVSVFWESRFYNILHHFLPLFIGSVKGVLNDQLNSFKPELIHGHVIYPSGLICRHLAQKMGLPYHLSEHWSKAADFFNNPIYGRKARRVYEQSYKVYPVSNWLKDKLGENLDTTTDFEVIPNIVNPGLFTYSPTEEIETDGNRNSNRLKMLVVMNLKHRLKRPDLIFEALQMMKQGEQKKIEITFIGSGQKHNKQVEEIQQKQLNTILHFKGTVPKQEVANEMKKADFLLHPSETETFGLVVVEALSVGLPIICSKCGALPEHVDETNGYLVSNNSVDEWKKVLRWALQHEDKFDRSEIARKTAGRFTYQRVGKSLVANYRKSLANQSD